MDGLEGSAGEVAAATRVACERVLETLARQLQRAVWAGDADAQLVLLRTWGLVIRPRDHLFLSRVGIFRTLQLVIEEARAALERLARARTAADAGVGARRPPGLQGPAGATTRVVRAALKVVHLLAAQVAYTDGSFSVGGGGGAGSGAMSPVPMIRTPSGPETLSRSLFDMLHSELLYALCQLRGGGGTAGVAADSDTAAAAARAAGWAEYEPTDAGSGEMTADRYCYRILGLVHSVSGSAVCQRFLSSPIWLRLLLGGVVSAPPTIQRRLLRLLRRLLPAVDPEGAHI
ncbi:unnamed protein product, partial [Phaeothamnion confervicola]